MGAILLFFYVIYQTVISTSLGGVTLPFSDLIGIVTPVKPKPLSPSTPSLPITKSPLVWEGEDIMPKLFSPVAGGAVFREFSSPLAFTSSSRALPVPKVDLSSITDVKLPERLRDKFLSHKVKSSPVLPASCNAFNNAISPLSYKYPFLSSPSTNTLPYSLSDMYLSSFNKSLSLPSVKSLPVVPLEVLERSRLDMLGSESTTNNILAPSSSTLMPRSRILDSPLSLETKIPSVSEQFSTNTLFPSSPSYSLPYPLYYKSMHLPRVRTPEMLHTNYRPMSYTGFGNFNVPIPSKYCTQNVLSPKPFLSDSNINSVSGQIKPSTPPYLNPIKTSDVSKPFNMIQVPKISSNVPFSTKPAFIVQNASIKNLWFPETEFGMALIPFKSSFPSAESSFTKPLFSSKMADKITDCTQTPVCPPKICSPIKPYPLIPTYSDFPSTPTSFDFNGVPNLKRINCPSSLIPEIPLYQYPILPEGYISNSNKFSPPKIPPELITTICSGTSTHSPNTCCSSRISETLFNPISYPNMSPSSLDQSTSSMLSSINDVVSNIAQNILSSYNSYINSAPQKPKCTPKSNPHINSGLESVPLPTVNPVNTKSVLPVINVPIDCINLPVIDYPSVSSTDTSCTSTQYEISSNQLSHISSSQPLPPLMHFSPPPICPSYLPSPAIPSYPTIASPFYIEAPVIKISSSKKDSSAEKLLELMLLAEILNYDDSFDWDDLDTLLALLSVS